MSSSAESNVLYPLADLPNNIDLFIAGGISNCPDWQTDAVALLMPIIASQSLVVANPRRSEGIPFNSPEAAYQIRWEHDALTRTSTILFWFPKESICPIALFELGAALERPNQQVFVGAEPEYERRFDIVNQFALVDSGIAVHSTLPELISDITRHFDSKARS